jgi:CRISPR system Cascade subunit CasD
MPSSSDTDFLAFRIWGPMAAWGDIAVGERRGTWNRPSRSAILGLIAACLGYERSNREAHNQLEAGLGFCVRVDDPGTPLRDYHTAQSPSRSRGKRWGTRADEVRDKNELNTILSERSYLVAPSAVIVLWRRPDTEGPTLAKIADCLVEPVFLPYLGRKSCPLGAPLRPHLLTAPDPVAALAQFDVSDQATKEWNVIRRQDPKRGRAPVKELWMDEADVRGFDLAPQHVVERTSRRDGIRDRPRWHFSDRAEVRNAVERAP